MPAMKKTHLILLGALALGIAGGGFGLLQYYKPHKDFGASAPDYTLTVNQLWKEFDAGEPAANAKFVAGDKTILLTGRISDVTTNGDGTCAVALSGEQGLPGSVACTMMPFESAKAQKLKAGETVRLKGQCTGMEELIEKQVVMIRCVIVEGE